MKLSTLILLGLLFIGEVSMAQKIFKDFNILSSPRADSMIVGKEKQSNGQFTGTGTKFIERHSSYDSFSDKVNKKTEIALAGIVEQFIEAKLGFSDSTYKVVIANNIRIVECTDYSQISDLNATREFVVSALVIEEFSVEKTNIKSAELYATLQDSSKLSKAFNVKPEIKYDKDRATVKLGSDLVLAIKTIKVTRTNAIDLTKVSIDVTDENKVSFVDYKPLKGKINIAFNSYDPINPEDVGGMDKIDEHQGCILMNVKHFIYQAEGMNIIICPDCNTQMTPTTVHPDKPDCQIYRPRTEFKPNTSFEIIRKKISKSKIVIYTVELNNLKVKYGQKPTDDVASNYGTFSGGVTVDMNISRYIHKIKNQ